MGNVITAPTATVSASIKDTLFRPRTALQGSLTHCYDLRTSAALGLVNTMTGAADVAVIGTPTYGTDGITISQGNGLLWPFAPTGRSTIAIIVRNKPDPYLDPDSYLIGSFVVGDCAQYFRWDNNGFNDRMTFDVLPFANYDENQTTIRGEIPMFAGTDLEMFVATTENFVGVKLYHPRTATVSSGNVADPLHRLDSPQTPKFTSDGSQGIAIDGNETLLSVARWSETLSSTEVANFYADAKAFYARQGVTLA